MGKIDLLIDEMPFSTRARNILKAHRISTLGDLASVIAGDKMGQWRGCGRSTIKEIEEIAAPYLYGDGAEPAALADKVSRSSTKLWLSARGYRGIDAILDRARTLDEQTLEVIQKPS